MANEKNTGSGPDDGLTESGSATPETNGIESNGLRGEYDELDALDEREGEFGDVIGSDDSDDDEYGDDDGDRARELVSVGAATTSRTASEGSSAAVSTATTETETVGRGRKKGRATPKQRARADRESKGGPVNFVRGSIAELQKVVYPTWPQLVNYFVVVLVFVLVIIGIVAGLDYGIGWAMLRLFS